MAYTHAISQINLVNTYGWSGVQISQNRQGELEPVALVWRIFSTLSSFIFTPTPSRSILTLTQRNVSLINDTHNRRTDELSPEEIDAFFRSATLFQKWNQLVSDELKISYKGYLRAPKNNFTQTFFKCTYETPQLKPLIVEPKPETDLNLISWAKANRKIVQSELDQHGALVFRGFGLTTETFPLAFEAMTGKTHERYKGAVPRKEVAENVYESSAVAPGEKIPLHQELSYAPLDIKPKYIAFYCGTPPQPGIGQTILADVRAVTEDIKASAPDIWALLNENHFTYSSRYLPNDTLRTKWIQLLNPSHASVRTRFGNGDPSEICKEQGYQWDAERLIVFKSGIPGTIEVNGETLFCSGLHLDIMSPELCGGKFRYAMARLLLYPTKASAQFDVQCDDGTPIPADIPGRILSILKRHEIVRDWKESGELLLVDNRTIMHGKNPHKGPRQLSVVMV